jgi:hypothetical protein
MSSTSQIITDILVTLLQSNELRQLIEEHGVITNGTKLTENTNSSSSIGSSNPSNDIRTNSSTTTNACCDFSSCKSIHLTDEHKDSISTDNKTNSVLLRQNVTNDFGAGTEILEAILKGNGYLESIDKNVKTVADQKDLISTSEKEKAVKEDQIKSLPSTDNTNQKLFNDIYGSAILQDTINKFSGDCTRNLEPIKPEVIRAQITLTNNIKETGNIIDKIASEKTVIGCTGLSGYTGAGGENIAVGYAAIPENEKVSHENCIRIPKGLSKVLGSWRGVIGQNLVKVRFECTSEKFALLTYISICTPPTAPFSNRSFVQEASEMLSSKVHYSKTFGENLLNIEDVMGQSLTAWVTDTDIIGKLADGSIVNLKRK